jgi:hypothetical protein
MKKLLYTIVLCPFFVFSQTTGLDKGIAIGNILVQGFAALHGNGNQKVVDPNAKTVASFCFKNKAGEKITVKLTGKIEDTDISKEFVIKKDEKECTFDLPKGVYTYEVDIANGETLQKGEYKVTEETLMTINKAKENDQ